MVIITEKIVTVKADTRGDTALIFAMALLAKEYLKTKDPVFDINDQTMKRERMEKFLDAILKEN